MKVIKKVDVSDWSHKHKCSNCDTELEVESKDVSAYVYNDYYHSEDDVEKYSAKCPVCENIFEIPIGIILKIELKKKYEASKLKSSSTYYDR